MLGLDVLFLKIGLQSLFRGVHLASFQDERVRDTFYLRVALRTSPVGTYCTLDALNNPIDRAKNHSSERKSQVIGAALRDEGRLLACLKTAQFDKQALSQVNNDRGLVHSRLAHMNRG